ncbi:hypothetical protein CN476_17820, partial [Bacillus cereus]
MKLSNRLNVINRLTLLVTVPILSILTNLPKEFSFLQPIKWLESIEGNMYKEFSYVKELIITEDENRRTTILNKLNDTNKETEKLQAQYGNTYINKRRKNYSINIKKNLQTITYISEQNKFIIFKRASEKPPKLGGFSQAVEKV